MDETEAIADIFKRMDEIQENWSTKKDSARSWKRK